MIDVNTQFFAMLTAVGEAKQVKADAGLITWKLTHMAVGDANDTNPIPDRLQKTLINERRRAPLNSLGPDPANPGILVAEQIIPADEGGFWIRELGLFDSDGDLVAVANCAPSYKSLLSQGSGKTQVLRMNFVVKSSSNVVLLIDPAVVTATRKYVDDSVANATQKLDFKQSVLVATTGPVVLAGVQAIDGFAVPAGSRVLVKDQAQAKDNGLYVVGPDSWVRTVDADTSEKVTPGMQVAVERGVANADTLWFLTTDGTIVLGTTALAFRNVTDGFATLDSPAFTGIPKAPTPPRFDRGPALATAEFVGKELGSFSSFGVISANRGLSTNEVGGLLWFSGNYTLSLPLPSALGLPIRASFNVFATSIGGMVAPQNGVNIQDQAGNLLTQFRIEPGQSVRLVVISDVQWLITDSTVGLEKNFDFRQSKAANGYRYLPGGMLECWGLSGATEDKVNITFAQQFSRVPFVVPYDSIGKGGTAMSIWQITDVSTTGFTGQNMCTLVRGSSSVNPVSLSQCNWRAWGWVDK